MKTTLLLGIGVVLLLAGVLGFLASAVALASVNEVPNVKTPPGITITQSPDDPQVVERQNQAETVLFGSLLCGGVGLFSTTAGIWLKKRGSRRGGG